MRFAQSFVRRSTLPLLLLGGAAAGIPDPAWAQRSGPPPAADDIDVRSSYWVALAPTAAQQAAGGALAGVTVRWNERLGVPASLIRYGGALTVAGVTPTEFLRSVAALFDASPEEMAALVLVDEYETRHNGARHLLFRQFDRGRPVHGSGLKMTLDRAGRIVTLAGTYYPGIAAEPEPLFGREETPSQAAERLAGTPPGAFADSARGAAELVTFPMPARGEARRAWRTLLDTDSGWVEQVVDAATGEILYRHRYASHAGPEGLVFEVQNPTLGAQQTVSFAGAPFDAAGWVTDRATAGNNANVYQDLDNDNSPDYQTQTPPSGDPAYQHFDYPFTNTYVTSGGTDVVTDRDAALTQAFYRINWLHDYFYELGFDEPARNFQEDNFGRGGMGGDGMQVEVHNGFSVGSPGSSNTQSPPDGMRPRMELKADIVDHAMDADLVTHEYTHGVSNRLVCGQNMPFGDQTWALGEGWSDFFGTSIFDDPIAGEYVCGNPAGCPLFAYDNTPLVYSDLCTLHPLGCEPHRDGEIWTAALWDIRTAMIARYGASGRNLTERLVVDGMKITPCTLPPDFLEARDALLAADVTTHLGAHQCLLWAAFARREMGVNAATSADQLTVTPDTTVPVGCTPTADPGGPYTTPEGTDQALDGSASSGGGEASAGAIVLYEWDLDGDGDYDDATGVGASFSEVGQDGISGIGLRVTNEAGLTATAATTVTVANVAPAVGLDSIPAATEGDTITLSGLASDPGWLDPLAAAVDWDDGLGPQPLPGTLENGRPDATLAFSQPKVYGDNGTFTVTVCASDDDTTTCAAVDAVVANASPSATIDPAGQSTYDGVSAYVAPAGGSITVGARTTDPGSDDLTLTWVWGDGSETVVGSLVNPPAADPPKSPSVQPRDLTLARDHAYGDACLYDLELRALDDDGGLASAAAAVVVVGNGERRRGSGWWMNQYRPKPPNDFSPATLECYLDIVVFFSTVFDTALDRPDAVEILFVAGNRGSAEELFDEQLLAAWLNFANGAIGLDDPVDTDGDGIDDTSFAAAVLTAEETRNHPAASREMLLEQKDILERIVES